MKLPNSGNNFRWAFGAATVAVCLIASAGQIAAAPRSSGAIQGGLGPPTRLEIALDANTDSALLAREGKTRDAFGFPVGVSRVGRHVIDGFQATEYDEVTELDAAGNVEALTQFNSKGRLRTAVRLDATAIAAAGPKVTQDGAVRSAQRSAVAAGLGVGAPTATEADQAAGGWTVHWARQQDGVRVRGDETRIHVLPDGRIQSVAIAEHDLAPVPARRIAFATARQVARANLDSWFNGRNSAYSIQKVELEWVGPNGAFDPARIATAEPPYRLAWVTDVKPSGDAAGYVWLMSLFVDAADGSIIGGDFVE